MAKKKSNDSLNAFKKWYEATHGEMIPRESTQEEKIMRAVGVTQAADQAATARMAAARSAAAMPGIDPDFAQYLSERGITPKPKLTAHQRALKDFHDRAQSESLSPLGRKGIFPVGSKVLQRDTEESPYRLAMEQYRRNAGAGKGDAEKAVPSIRNTTPEMHDAFRPFEREDNYKLTREGRYAKEHPVVGTGGYVLSGIGSGITGPINVAEQLITGEKVHGIYLRNAFEQQNYQEGVTRAVQNLFGGKEDGVATRGEQVSGFLTGVGLSAAESLGRAAIGHGLGLGEIGTLALAAGGAANNALVELNGNENIGARQAALAAISRGAMEAATEKFSLGNMEVFKKLGVTPANAKALLKAIRSQALIEGSEEVAADFGNLIGDQLILGEESEYNQNVKNYMLAGLDEESARTEAAKDFLKGAGTSFIAGGLSGGLMGGILTTANYLSASKAGAESFIKKFNKAEDYRLIADSVSDETEAGAETKKLAAELAEKKEQKKKISFAEKGRLASLMVETTEAENALHGTGAYDRIADWINTTEGDYADPEAYRRALEAYGAARALAQKEADGQPISEEENRALWEAVKSSGAADYMLPESYRKAKEAYDVKKNKTGEFVPETEDDLLPETVSMPEVAPVQQEAGYEKALQKAPVPVNVTAKLDSLAAEIAANYEENGAKAYRTNYRRGEDLGEYSKRFSYLYNMARYGQKRDDIKSASLALFTPEQVENIYTAAVQDRNALDQKLLNADEYRERQEKKTGGLIEAVPGVSEGLKTTLQKLGEQTGIDFIITDTGKYSGSYQTGAGVVRIDLSAENPLAAVSHEMTHWMKEYNPVGYSLFRDAAVSSLIRNGLDLDHELESYRAAYEEAGQKLSKEELVEEIVSDSTGTFLNDEQFIKEVCEKEPSIGKRVVDWLKSVCEALKELITDRSLSRAARTLKEELETYEKARGLWMQGINDAAQIFEEVEAVGEENNTKYKIAEPAEITEEKLEENFDRVRNMEPVYALTGKEFVKSNIKLDEQVLNEYKKIGYKARNPVVGEVELNKSAITDAMSHALGNRFRVAAFAAVPDVIEKGQVLSYIENWKEKPEDDRVVIGARVTYGGEKAFEIVVAKVKTRTNTLYLQDVQLQRESSESRSAAAGNNQPVTDTGTLELSYSSIFKKLLNVNGVSPEYKNIMVFHEDYDYKKNRAAFKQEHPDEKQQYHPTENPTKRLNKVFRKNNKEGAALNDVPLRQNTASGSPSYDLSIGQPLEGVNEGDPDMLPEDVLRQSGPKRSGEEDIENLRYQLNIAEEDMPNRDLIAENEDLRNAVGYLTGMLNTVKGVEPSSKDIKNVVKNMAEKYHSDVNRKGIEDKVTRLYSYLRTAYKIDGAEVNRVAAAIANEVLSAAQHTDPMLEKQWKDFRKTMRSQRIYIPEVNIADLAPDGWNSFRKQWFGKIAFTKNKEYSDGTYDGQAVYRRLQNEFPDYFPDDADMLTDDDAIHRIMEAFDVQRPVAEPYYKGATRDEAALMLGQEIIDAYAAVGSQSVRAQYQKSYKQITEKIKHRVRAEYLEELKEHRIRTSKELKNLERAYKAKELDLKAYVVEKDVLLDYRNQERQAAAMRWRKLRDDYEDSQKRSSYKRDILKNTMKLTRMLEQPTDKAHVPVFMLEGMKNVVDSINFALNPQRKDGQLKKWAAEGKEPKLMQTSGELKTAITNAANQFQSIKDSEGVYTDTNGNRYYLVVDPNIIFNLNEIAKMFKETESLKGNLDKLTGYELQTVRDTMTSLVCMTEAAGSFISNEHYKSVNQAAEETIRELSERKAAKELNGTFAGGFQSMLRSGMLDSYSYFDIMGTAGKHIYEELRSGLDKKIQNTKIAQDYLTAVKEKHGIKDKEMRAWSRELKEVDLITRDRNGNLHRVKAKITDAQRMSLYLLNKRGQARMHMYGSEKDASAGGIKLSAVKDGLFKTDSTTVYKVDEATVNRLISGLTEQQKAIADAVGHFLTDVTSAWGNEVTMILYGYRKFTAGNYFPIDVDDNTIGVDSKALENSTTLLKNMGSTKSVQQRAYNPLIVHDIFDVYTEQADSMGSYNAFVIATADMQKWFNYKNAETNVRAEIDRALGKDANEYFMNILRDINGSRAKADKYEFAYKLAGNAKAAAIGTNIRVAIQQPTAYARALAEMDGKYLLKGLWIKPGTSAEEWELCKKYAPIAQWKDWGYFDINTGRSMKALICGQDSRLEALKEAEMWGAGKMDEVAWVRLWKASQEQVKDQNPDLNVGSEEFYQEAGKVFSHIIDTTQVVDSVLHRTDMMKSKSAYVKSITSFMAEPMKSYNMIYREMAKLKAGDAGAKKKLARVIAVYLVSKTLTDAAAAVWDAVRNGDKDKKFLEKWFDAFMGDVLSAFTDPELAFSERAGILITALMDETGLTNIPFVKDIVSMIRGFGSGDMTMQGISGLFSAGNEILKVASGESKNGALGSLYRISYAGSLFGISSRNAMKDAGGALNTFIFPAVEKLGIASENEIRYREDLLMKNMKHKDNKAYFVKEMIRAYESGEKELGDRILEDLLEAGYDEEQIRKSVEKQLGKEPEYDIAAQAYVDNDMKTYEENRKLLINSGYEEEMVDRKLQSRSDSLMKDIASYGLIADALLGGDAAAAETAYDRLVEYELRKNPKKSRLEIDKAVRKGIKTNISNRYKKDYVNVPEKRAEIQQTLNSISLTKIRLYNSSDYGRWYKD